MATIKEIAMADAYKGTAEIGRIVDNPIKIDTSPLLQLAQYTYLYKSQERAAAEKEAQARLKDLAEMSALDWQNAIPKEREEAIKVITDFKDYSRNIATKDLKDPNVYLEYQMKRNDAKRKVTNINARFISYGERQKKIAETTNVLEKQRLQGILDKDVANTTSQDPLPLVDQFDIKPAAIPKTPVKDIKIARIGPNNNTEIKNLNITDIPKARSLASSIVALKQARLDKATPEEKAAFDANGTLSEIEEAKTFTDAINSPVYRDANNKVDLSKLLSSNTPVSGIVRRILNINQERAILRERADKGEFGDQLSSADIPDIKWEDGTSAEEIVELKILENSDKQVHEEDMTHTGDANTRRGQDINAADNQAKNALGWAKLKQDGNEFKLKEKQFTAAQNGSSEQVNGAMSKAKRIYADLEKIAGPSGIIRPEEVRKLNTEQLKYLGIEVVSDDKKSSVYTPLSFKDKDGSDVSAAIRLRDGNIDVLNNAVLNQETNKFGGNWDNTKSTNIFNIATNVLNEQLKTAGSKELNAYWGIDVTGGNTSFTENKTSSSSGGSSSQTIKVPNEIPTLTSKDQFNALPKGAFYYRNGQKYQK